MNGYIHIYSGNGKGKTTAAFGLALRAVGAGKRIYIAQFVKGQPYSEIEAVNLFLPAITIKQYGLDCFIYNKPTFKDIEAARNGLADVTRIIAEGDFDMVILDEACIAIYYNLFTTSELIETLKAKPEAMEIIITGRYATAVLIEFADLVTEMKEIKHYIYKRCRSKKRD